MNDRYGGKKKGKTEQMFLKYLYAHAVYTGLQEPK